MKIIDLLNKIANGEEVPKKIKYNGIIYKKVDIGEDYYNFIIDKWFFKDVFDASGVNLEIEILDEEKKIPEKLDYCEENTFMIKCKENSYLTREEIRLLDSNFKELGNKINEVLDYLKSKGE